LDWCRSWFYYFRFGCKHCHERWRW
jgi:hypothetical protein